MKMLLTLMSLSLTPMIAFGDEGEKQIAEENLPMEDVVSDSTDDMSLDADSDDTQVADTESSNWSFKEWWQSKEQKD